MWQLFTHQTQTVHKATSTICMSKHTLCLTDSTNVITWQIYFFSRRLKLEKCWLCYLIQSLLFCAFITEYRIFLTFYAFRSQMHVPIASEKQCTVKNTEDEFRKYQNIFPLLHWKLLLNVKMFRRLRTIWDSRYIFLTIILSVLSLWLKRSNTTIKKYHKSN